MQLNKGLIPRVPGKAPRTLTSLLTCFGATSGGGGRARVLGQTQEPLEGSTA